MRPGAQRNGGKIWIGRGPSAASGFDIRKTRMGSGPATGVVNTIMAMKALNYYHDPLMPDPRSRKLEATMGTRRCSPATRPYRDVHRGHRAGRRGSTANTLRRWNGCCREIRRAGDCGHQPDRRWEAEPRVRQHFYPDIDDTAILMLALRHVHLEERPSWREKACLRGLHWLLAMQSSKAVGPRSTRTTRRLS